MPVRVLLGGQQSYDWYSSCKRRAQRQPGNLGPNQSYLKKVFKEACDQITLLVVLGLWLVWPTTMWEGARRRRGEIGWDEGNSDSDVTFFFWGLVSIFYGVSVAKMRKSKNKFKLIFGTIFRSCAN